MGKVYEYKVRVATVRVEERTVIADSLPHAQEVLRLMMRKQGLTEAPNAAEISDPRKDPNRRRLTP